MAGKVLNLKKGGGMEFERMQAAIRVDNLIKMFENVIMGNCAQNRDPVIDHAIKELLKIKSYIEKIG